MAEGLEVDDFQGLFQPKPFCYRMILQTMSSFQSTRTPRGEAFSELHVESQGKHAWPWNAWTVEGGIFSGKQVAS